MDFELSKHAQSELVRRAISLQLVERVLDSPEQVFEENGLKVYQSKFVATNGKTYLLRIFVNDVVFPPKVVTVYRTSKITKYWR